VKKILAILMFLMLAVSGLWAGQASLPYATSNGTTADGGEVDADFDEIYSKYNAHDTAVTGVHGAGAGTIATTTNSLTLTNKSLTSPTITGSPTAAGATWTDLGTVTTAAFTGFTVISSTHTKVDINGGTIDGTVIGGTTPAAIAGTTGAFTGDITCTQTISNTSSGINFANYKTSSLADDASQQLKGMKGLLIIAVDSIAWSGVFLIGGGYTNIISQTTGSVFVASMTPSAGEVGIGYQANQYYIVNNYGSALVFNVGIIASSATP
jgi:hypothetical protein